MSNPARTRTVLVTGGAKRLGREFCLAFAQAGWNVICHYQASAQEADQTCREIQQRGGKALSLCADLSAANERESLLQSAIQAADHGLDAVVNNASVFEPDTGIAFSSELLQQQLQVNLLAPLHLGSLLAQYAKSQRREHPPALIHILDQKVFNLNPDYFSYTVSKLALERSVALQAQALAPHVRVTAIAPGLIFESGPQSADNFERAQSVNLMRSPIDPHDVARSAVFLAENRSITGTTLCVDKGQHLVPLERDVMFVVDQLTRSQT
jgi:NAD(P)-dependent dehydrogenase (short-subunit alcohol dehydrogenase family)